MELTIYVLTGVGTIAGYIGVEKWLLPQLLKMFKYFDNRKKEKDLNTLDVNKELIENKENNNNLYESQISFYYSQVENLQRQLIKKSGEIEEMSIQCDNLMSQLLTVKKELFDIKQTNMKLIGNQCLNTDCQYRIKNNNNK